MAWVARRRLLVGLLALALLAAECQNPLGDPGQDDLLAVINHTDQLVNITFLGPPIPVEPGGRNSSSCSYFNMVSGELADGTLLFPHTPVVCEQDPPRPEFEATVGALVRTVCDPPYLVLSPSTAPPDGWDQPCTLDAEAVPDWPDAGWERPAFIDVEDQGGNVGVIHNLTDRPIEVTWRVRQRTTTIGPGEFVQVDCPIGYLSVTSAGRVIDRGTPLVCDPNPEFSKVAYGTAWVEYAVMCQWPYLVAHQQVADWRPEPCPLELDRFPEPDGCWHPDSIMQLNPNGEVCPRPR
jgi:hypothetical protein